MDRRLYALDLQSGAELWRFEAGGAFASTPALWDGTLYIGAFDDTFYAVDAATGTLRWTSSGENWFWGNPVVYEGTIYTVDVSGNVYALDAQSGAQVWHENLSQANDTPVRAGPALTEDGLVLLIGSENGKLYALDTASGTTKWSTEGEGQILSQPIISGTTIYQMSMNSPQRIRALHVDNGYEIWAYPREAEEQQ
jgi:outer membrane protein assembly factor BamB